MHRRSFGLTLLASLSNVAPGRSKPSPPPQLTRARFQERIASLQSGMQPDGAGGWRPVLPVPARSTRRAVEAHIGAAQRVDPVKYGFGRDDVRRLAYGCLGAKGLPTLGAVFVDPMDRILATSGGFPEVIRAGLVPELRLRSLLSRMDLTSEWYWNDQPWNCRNAVELINGLRALGPAAAEAVVREYVRVLTMNVSGEWRYPSESSRIHTLLPFLWQDPAPPKPHDLKFGPLGWVAEGVPFFMSYQGGIGGSVSYDLEKWGADTKGKLWIREPLKPQADLNRVLESTEGQPWWPMLTEARQQEVRKIVRDQMATLQGPDPLTD